MRLTILRSLEARLGVDSDIVECLKRRPLNNKGLLEYLRVLQSVTKERINLSDLVAGAEALVKAEGASWRCSNCQAYGLGPAKSGGATIRKCWQCGQPL
jgi:hypothetical protein